MPGILLATWEFGVHVNPMTVKPPENDVQRRDVDRLLEFMNAYRELYPDHPDGETFQGLYYLNMEDDWTLARMHFENALESGVKTDKYLLYYYAFVLVQLREDPAKIEAAIANWRKNFPHSKFPDPRDA